MPFELVKETPPDRSQRRSEFDGIKDNLVAAPGEWFRIREYDTSQAAVSMSTSLKKRYTDDGFEFKTRTVEGKARLYARHS